MNIHGQWLEDKISKNDAGQTIEDYLKTKWRIPKKMLHQFRMSKNVHINGEPLPWKNTLKEDDTVSLPFFETEPNEITPHNVEIEILFEDEHVLIVNKPIKIDTHPSSEHDQKTLLNAVAAYFQKTGLKTKPRHVHRLDRDTSGAILFTKHFVASSVFDQLLAERKINRTYIALVQGIIKKEEGIINEPIGRDRHHATRRRVSRTGQAAKTSYRVLKRNTVKNETLIELSLETGRTHQIRVHMSHIGHPLLGDTLYGGNRLKEQQQALHAIKLSFIHPFTHQLVSAVAPPNQQVFLPYSNLFSY
ncbi:RluA family pseudouridine synthase [Priestia aryabhattai]|uniref:RluA family pseudouridine synthase n=1 Tax=Priestia megaterium TaxID=1404 RepID=UPI0039B92130